jgi:hypothetical protein
MDDADPLGAGSRRGQSRLDLVLAGDLVAEDGHQQTLGDGVQAADPVEELAVAADGALLLLQRVPEHGVYVAGVVRQVRSGQLGPLHEMRRVVRDGPAELGDSAGEPAGVPLGERDLLGQLRFQDDRRDAGQPVSMALTK